MNEQERLKLLLESSRERLRSRAKGLLQDPAVVAAIRRNQQPKENNDALEATCRKVAGHPFKGPA